jgi:DNA-binding LacI/PurR family transcriptional regulator
MSLGYSPIEAVQYIFSSKMKTTKRSTLLDLARETGLSRAAVSYALNEHQSIPEVTRQKVREAADRLGYLPNAHAQNLASGRRGKTVDMFVMGLDSAIGSQHALTIQWKLFNTGYKVPLHAFGFAFGKDEAQGKVSIVEMVRGFRQNRSLAVVCALIPEGLPEATYDELNRYMDEGGIVVTYGCETKLSCDQAIFDAAAGIYIAARHLIDQGHRDIGFSSFVANDRANPWTLGFERALGESDIPVTTEWLVCTSHFESGGAELAQWFDQRKKSSLSCPTALVIVNDAAASIFVSQLTQMGYKVPDDISVVGFDDLPVAQYGQVPLTTIHHPVIEIAGLVTEFVDSRVRGFSGAPRKQRVEMPLVQRQSVRTV